MHKMQAPYKCLVKKIRPAVLQCTRAGTGVNLLSSNLSGPTCILKLEEVELRVGLGDL